ncbi:MAG: radical SAM protein [Candidatus Azobacteroides sp.]|nr:radical SAM protein [Candidatus Azobacteroides sp.]
MLFHEIVFGPIKSRRLGISLGINLLPSSGKICTFDCIYCECGYNVDGRTKQGFPPREAVVKAIEAKLQELKVSGIIPDVFTFSGNGEPTLHPEFEEIIDDTIELRNKYFPQAKISVLSNSTMIDKENVFRALNKVDNNILKLDSVFNEKVKLIDQPLLSSLSVAKLIENLKRFNGNLIIQTIFLKGVHNGQCIDNTNEEEVNAWVEALKEINPKQVMIYTIDRATPEKNLQKVSLEELNVIAGKLKKAGFKVSVSG